MNRPLVFNIQKYSIHDGEGIRTTVFFKGCPLSCRWCHNPESQSFRPELMVHPARCTGCGACVAVCPQKAVSFTEDHKTRTDRSACVMCGACVDACVHNAREEAGKEYEIKDLVKQLEKDRMFYEESGGGITLSGGEVLSQNIDYVEELARRLYQKGYSVDIDTCGFAPYEHIKRLLPYVDTFLYDIKLMDPEAHRAYTGADNTLILDNLKRLSADGGKINLRLPLIQGVNATEEFIQEIIAFLKENRIGVYRVNLLKYHNTGRGKYGRLDRVYEGEEMSEPSQEFLDWAAERFRQSGYSNIVK